jgi:hypothetical protein
MTNQGVNAEFFFLLKKQIFLNPQTDPKDTTEFDLLFHQSVLSVLRGIWPCDEATAIKLAGMQFEFENGNNENFDVPKTDEEIARVSYY